MNIKEIHVDKLMKKITKKDRLFHGNYTIDPYQNCLFGCIYCDSILDDTIYVKMNATTILNKEIQRLPPGRIIIGSVHDPYQPVEKKYQLTHDLLLSLSKTDFPVHILTKSTTIHNDVSIIKQLTCPIVTFTVLGLDEHLWKTIEPYAPSPEARLQIMQTLAQNKIKTGIAIIPIFPRFPMQNIEALIKKAKDYQASYILYKPLFLQGKQKEFFLKKIKKSYPNIHDYYEILYNKSPVLPFNQNKQIDKKIKKICKIHHLPITI